MEILPPTFALSYCGFSGEAKAALRGGRTGVSRQLELRTRGNLLNHIHSLDLMRLAVSIAAEK
jgi:hypothetical protein